MKIWYATVDAGQHRFTDGGQDSGGYYQVRPAPFPGVRPSDVPVQPETSGKGSTINFAREDAKRSLEHGRYHLIWRTRRPSCAAPPKQCAELQCSYISTHRAKNSATAASSIEQPIAIANCVSANRVCSTVHSSAANGLWKPTGRFCTTAYGVSTTTARGVPTKPASNGVPRI